MKWTFLAGVLAAATFAGPALAFEPSNTECIAPSNPGGGWDFTCRSIGKLLQDQGRIPGQMQVVNMAGGVGAVAFGNVASKRPADPNLIVATSTVGITQIAQGRYPGGVDTMRWLGMLGADVGVVLVAKDSPYETLDEVIDALLTDPAAVPTGGSSSVGGWDHIRLLAIAKEKGADQDALKAIRWVQYQGGSDAVTQMLGGHIAVVTTDIGEISSFIESGDARVLAVMAEDRLPAFPDAPTAKEQGYDMTGYNWRGFYMGGDVPDEAYDWWVGQLEELYNTDAWQELAVQNGLTPRWLGGAEFTDFVAGSVVLMEAISKDIGVIQ
jgi:putative tricarboxylic transport membrane protein